ncbi:MAG: ArsR family transcriptional regulator [Hyphomonadaceae bacterium]|nr:ArsR family transcriptional regulator [Hyphomonadaceae bacterium]
MKSKQAISALSALAHDGRLAAFRLLVRAGPDGMAAGEIAQRIKMPPSTLSTNLLLLLTARLVTSRREGRSIIYTADFDTMGDLLSFLIEDCCNGSPQVCAPLAGVLETCSPGKCR